jgi:simple sugar transport system ATP-binding protein
MTAETNTEAITPAPVPVLEARDIVKSFGIVRSLTGVTVKGYAGKVTCILGDNGAGKSTLIKTLAGFHAPDSGALYVLKKGIGPVKLLDVKRSREICKAELARMGIDIRDVNQPVGTLSGGERQSAATARAVYFGARVLILDEPTSALGVRQAAIVLKNIQLARQAGHAVFFITHSPAHAMLVGDSFTLLSRGRVIGQHQAGKISEEQLIHEMAGGQDLDRLREDLGSGAA